MMESRQFQYLVAGILSFCTAFLAIPLLGLGILVASPYGKSFPIQLIANTLSVINLLINLYVLYLLKLLFNDRFKYTAADGFIYAIIVLSTLTTIYGILPVNNQSPSLFSIDFLINLILLIAGGIAYVLLSFKIKSIPEDLYGFKTLLFGFMLATGIGMIGTFTCILIPALLVAAVGCDIVIGLVFLKASYEAPNNQLPTGGTNV
jgi:hypothetical protein